MSATRPRGPGVAYTSIAMALLLLIGFFALTQRQPPPPTIAEFAPQAVENIAEAPSDQSSSSGRSGGVGAGASTPTPEPARAVETIELPRVRRCVGDPPRQIEDPQSPPCVPYWNGDNGGATSKGVTRDSIKIMLSSEDYYSIVAFFNARFEFYGRKLVPAGLTDDQQDDAAAHRAQAARADEEIGAFAVMPEDTDGKPDYFDEIARRGLIGIDYRANFPETWLSAHRPHLWQYMMGSDRLMSTLGTWACSRLVGRPARYAGDPTYQGATRVFGMILQSPDEGGTLGFEEFDRSFERCGQRLAVRVNEPGFDGVGKNVIIQMKTAGVTSLFCQCNVTSTGVYSKAATSQAYYPEWLLSSFGYNDETFHSNSLNGDRTQLDHSFGLTVQPKHLNAENTPARWAELEGDPESLDTGAGALAATRNQDYRQLLLLASGIQMAGPNLTPATFQRGLQNTVFPNPATPLMAGAVGFRDADHTMTDDVAEWWWSSTDRGPYTDTAGATCYVDGGARRSPNAWPEGDGPFFQRPCDAGVT